MNCAQRILYNGINVARTATLAASTVRAASDTIRTLPTARDGSAAVALSGAYTGANDATFDVEIIDTTVSAPIVSAPQFAGVGNGVLSAITFSGAAQKFTLELADDGLPTLFASVAFAGVNIVARASGAAGNGIAITVNSSALTYTQLPFSLIAPLPKDTRKSDAVGLDFNAAVMAADNQFPTTAKRITFGPDKTQVYRQAKKWTGAKWEYLFEPPLQAYQPAGTRVSEVAGTYTVTVTQGATTEPFAGIKTNYDLLVALNTLSTLVRVDGVIANDRAADGQAAGDLSMRTDAYALPAVGSGSSAAQNAVLEAVVIGAGAPTEIIELKCWASTSRDSPNAHLGAEIWSAKGSVTGDIGNFKTGDTISPASGNWSLVIPAVYPVGYGDARGEFSVRSIDTVSRTAPAVAPPICVVGMALGPDAIDQTVTLTYTKRPTADCACDDLPVPDLSNSECLMGPNNPNAPGATSVSYPATISARMTALWDWRADVADDYSDDRLLTSGTTPDYEKQRVDKSTIIATLLQKTAIAVNAAPAALALWDTMFTDVQAQYTVPPAPPAPPAPTPKTLTALEAIAIGQVVIVSANLKIRLAAAPYYGNIVPLYLGVATVAVAGGATTPASTVAIADDRITGLSGLTADAIYKLGVTPGTLSTPPGVPDDRVAVGVTATTAVPSVLNAAYVQWITNANPIFFSGVVAPVVTSTEFNVILERFQTRCDAILASAGISPLGKSDASTVSDDGCWQDFEGEAYYWAINGSERGAYLPAFNNTPYFSSRNVAGHIAATHEFAFQVNVLCPQGLLAGDRITLAIGNAGWSPTYQVGDAIAVSVIAASPQTLAGGQNGNAAQKWHVSGDAHGPFAVFTATNGSGSYSNAGLLFTLTSGGIRFAKGDRFAFSAEGGHWRWRESGGAWVGPLVIASGAVSLAAGVSATFTPGAAPSFVPADRYSFAVRQPNSPVNAQSPNELSWRWIGASATLDVDLGSALPFDSIAIARHRLPVGAGVTVQAGTTLGATNVLAATAITLQTGTLAHLLDAPITARYVRISVTAATDGALGWVYVGQGFNPNAVKHDDVVRRDYAMDRGGGLNSAARLLGKGSGGSIDWPEGTLEEVSINSLVDMLDWLKGNGDEPLIYFPSVSRPAFSLLAAVDSDQVELTEWLGYQAGSDAERRYSARIGLSPVMQ